MNLDFFSLPIPEQVVRPRPALKILTKESMLRRVNLRGHLS